MPLLALRTDLLNVCCLATESGSLNTLIAQIENGWQTPVRVTMSEMVVLEVTPLSAGRTVLADGNGEIQKMDVPCYKLPRYADRRCWTWISSSI